MPRPVMLGIVGDSGSGKTTITRGLVRVLGEDQVTHLCTDDYHRFDRRQRAERNVTPLHPDCNHLDILAQHLRHLRAKDPIMKPVYQHTDGTFAAPDYFIPGRFLVTEGLLVLQPRALREVRRPGLPRPAGGAAPPVEGTARPLAPRLPDRPGSRRDRPSRARLRDVHPAAAPQRRPHRLIPTLRGRRSGAPRLQAHSARLAPPPRPDRRDRRRRGRRRPDRPWRRRPGALRPRADPPRARTRDRGVDLGTHALRAPPARAAARRVHNRDRTPSLGLARRGAAPDPL